MSQAVHTIRVEVYNTAGKVVGERELPASIFGIEPQEGLVHLAVVAQQANARKVIASTKSKAEVRGGGKKPWKQKGTGRARHGSIRSPIWRGGGVVFGPRTDRNYSLKINKKARRKAVCMVLSQRVTDKALFLIDALSFEKPKTKEANGLLSNLPVPKEIKRKTIALVSPKGASALVKSFRNIPDATIVPAHSLNVVDLLNARYVVMPLQSVDEIEKTFSKELTATSSEK